LNTSSLARLLALAAIWGASFLFMRIGAPVLGPTLLIMFRVGLAAVFLLAVGLLLKRKLHAVERWRHYLVLGFFNSAVPFLLFAYAARTLSASLLSILNATAPLWAVLLMALRTRVPLARSTVAGLALGVVGVALLVRFDRTVLQPGAALAVVAVLGAALSYGVASIYAKAARKVDPFSNAHGSMWAATLLIAPAVPFFPATTSASMGVMAAVLALGIICSGVAYLLYFRLIADVGPASALTVTFLIPVFGVLWGRVFLGEVIGWHTIAGSVCVVMGTVLVTGFSLRSLVRGRT
jgi:drug/metabolite transporter (DMT)-like permease